MADIHHDPASRRFTSELDGQLAQLDYELEGDVMSITHTRVPPAFRGRGVAGELMHSALAFADAKKLRVNPVCSYAVAYLQRHAEDQAQRHREALLDEALDESFPASDPPAVGGVD